MSNSYNMSSFFNNAALFNQATFLDAAIRSLVAQPMAPVDRQVTDELWNLMFRFVNGLLSSA